VGHEDEAVGLVDGLGSRLFQAPATAGARLEGHRAVTRSFLLLVAGAIAIGFAPIFVRLASTGPIATAFWRMALAVPILWMFVRQQNDASSALVAFRSPLVWLAGAAFALDLAAWHFSIRLTSVTNATLLANCAVLLVPLFSWVFLRRPVRSNTLGFGLLAFFGMILLSSPSLRTGSQKLLGDALALLTAGFYAAYLLVMAVARERAAASSLAFASSLLSSVTLLPIVALAGERLLPSEIVDWMWLIGLALISQVFGQTAIAHALGRIPPAQAAVGLLIQPVSAAVFAWILFGESLSGLQFFGGALVLASITAVRLFER
jgi:drug/metabolite transporter (DMT)-like permease